MDNKTRLKRLKQLKFMMENHEKIFLPVENIKFDMSEWFQGELKHGCGTAACVLGSAALYPPFKEQGLRLKKDEDYFSTTVYPEYMGYFGSDAGEVFFGIDFWDAELIFFNGGKFVSRKVTIKQAVKNIQKVIDKYEK